MQDFIYERPETIGEAIAAMRADDARALAGGTDLVPQLREGRRRAARIVDLKHIPELTAITALPDGGVQIGAAVTATAVARHAAIAAGYPAVAESAQLIGGVQVQNRASLGGNICNAAPSADGVPALICHGAQALIAGPNGTREMPVEAIFAGPGRTTLAAGEMLDLRSGCRRCAKFGRRLSALHAATRDGHRHRRSGGLAAARRGWRHRARRGSRWPRSRRRRSARRRPSEKLVGERPSGALFEEAGRLAAQDARPISDTRGSADYRRYAGRGADGARARRLRPQAWY